MYFLSNEWFDWFNTNYSVLIGWVKLLIGGPIGTYVALKLAAVMSRNVSSNNIIDLVQNTIGKVNAK